MCVYHEGGELKEKRKKYPNLILLSHSNLLPMSFTPIGQVSLKERDQGSPLMEPGRSAALGTEQGERVGKGPGKE